MSCNLSCDVSALGGGHCGLGWSCLLCCSGSVPRACLCVCSLGDVHGLSD